MGSCPPGPLFLGHIPAMWDPGIPHPDGPESASGVPAQTPPLGQSSVTGVLTEGGGDEEKGGSAEGPILFNPSVHIQPWNSEESKSGPVLAFKVIMKAYLSAWKDRTCFI